MFGHFSPAEEHGCLLNITHSWISPSCCAMSDKQQAKLSKGDVSAGLKALVKNVRLSCREQSHLFPSSFSTKCWCAENPRRIFNLSYWQISKARADPFCALFRANRHDQITDLYLMNSRYNASEITLAWTFALPKAFGTSRCVPAVTGPNTSSDVPFSRDCANQTHSRELTSCLQDKTDIDLDQAATATGRCVEMTSFQSKWQLGEEIDKLKKKKRKKKGNFASRRTTTTGENLRSRLRRRQTYPEIAHLQRAPDHLTWCSPSFYQMETIQKECSVLNETQISRWRWVLLVHIFACRLYRHRELKKIPCPATFSKSFLATFRASS